MILTFYPYKGDSPQKIRVIKEIRIITGLSLKEAKDIADELFSGSQMNVNTEFGSKDTVLTDGIRELAEYGIKVEIDSSHFKAMKQIKEHIKDILALCTEEDEAELLEVVAIAFKMVCEK